jgi:hypothetical protein
MAVNGIGRNKLYSKDKETFWILNVAQDNKHNKWIDRKNSAKVPNVKRKNFYSNT